MDLDKATNEMTEAQIESAESQYDEEPERPHVNIGRRRGMKGNLAMAMAMGLMGQGMMGAPSRRDDELDELEKEFGIPQQRTRPYRTPPTPKKPNASNGRPKDAATKKRRAKKKAGAKSRKKNRK